MYTSVSVAILAGGHSSRMGRNKAFIKINRRPIIERIIERVQPLADDILIVTNKPTQYTHLGLHTYTDVIPNKGPLGGLFTAIHWSPGDYTLVVSCDQPFLNTTLLQSLIDLRNGYDVVVPLSRDNYPQSMHAVYGRTCLDAIRRSLEANRLKIISFFSEVNVREVSDMEIDRYDPERLSFYNVNTPDDLAQAEQIAIQVG
jgi:molybdopterin-guanine dinucleotide biosynthesis protein A